MKIGPLDSTPNVAPAASERRTGTPAPQAQPAAPAAASSATVAISPEASALAAGDGSFDAAKVERMGRAIEQGTFKPNPEAIADKLIANAQELLSRTYR